MRIAEECGQTSLDHWHYQADAPLEDIASTIPVPALVILQAYLSSRFRKKVLEEVLSLSPIDQARLYLKDVA